MDTLTLQQFYAETLKAAGFVPPTDEIEKFASEQKIEVETAKIARSIFEQLQLDDVKYETEQARFTDSIKIAEAYIAHVKEVAVEAEKLAGNLHRVARHAIEGYLAHNGLELDADEGVKIAGLQASSFQELTQREARLRQVESKLASCTYNAEAAKIAAGELYKNLGTPLPHESPGNIDPQATVSHIASSHNADPNAYMDLIQQTVPKEQHADYLHAGVQELRAGKHPDILKFHAATQARMNGAKTPAAPGVGGWIGENPGKALGVAGIGLGALYYMRKKKQEAEAARNRQNALTGAASMPMA